MEKISQQHDDLEFLSASHSAAEYPTQQGSAPPESAPGDADLDFLLSNPATGETEPAFADSPTFAGSQPVILPDEQDFTAVSTDELPSSVTIPQDKTTHETALDADFAIQSTGDDADTSGNFGLKFAEGESGKTPDIVPVETDQTGLKEIPGVTPFSTPHGETLEMPPVVPDEIMTEAAPDFTKLPANTKKDGLFRRLLNWLQKSLSGPTNIGIDTSMAMTKSVSISLLAKKMTLVEYDKIEFGQDTVFDNESDSENARLLQTCDFLLPKIKPGDWLVGGIAGIEVIYRVL